MKYFFLVFFASLNFLIYSQKYKTIRYFNQNIDLNSEIVYNIEEDLNNYFWMSTDNGIFKYNGNSFKKFTIKNGLPSNDIFKIKIDSRNRIWLTGYYYGLYYIYKDKVVKVKNSEKYTTLEYLYENKDTVFFKNHYFVNIKYVTKKNKLESLPLNLNRVRMMTYNDKGIEVYRNAKTWNYFVIYNNRRINVPKGYVFYPNLSSTVPTFVKDYSLMKYHSLNRIISNDIIFLKDGKWNKFLKTKEFEKIKILSRDFDNNYTYVYDSKNKIIVLKDNIYNPRLTKLYSSLPIDKDKIYFTFIDKSKNIWVITNDNQLVFVPNNYDQISSYNSEFIFKNKFSSIKYGIKYKDKFFLITNNNEFGFFDLNNKFSVIDIFKNEALYKIIVNNEKLILCTNKSHYYYDINSYSLIKKFKSPANKNSKIIDNELIYSKGASLNINDSVILSIKNSIRFKDFVKINDKFYCSNEDFIISKSIYDKFHTKREIKYVNVIEKYNDLILVGTNSNGLFLLNSKLETVQKVNNNKNIIDIKVEKNIIYVLTTNSLHVYEIVKNKLALLKVKSSKDGIHESRNKNINIDSKFIYIYSQYGITKIKKINIKTKSEAEIDFECLEFPTYTDKTIKLNRKTNTLNFLFNVNTFENEKNFKKFIRLENDNSFIKHKWEELSNKSFTYKDLKPGHYKLTLKLTSENLYKDQIKEINFYIEPYFWETTLFSFIVTALIILIIALLYLYFKNKANKRYYLQNKINYLELKALKSQMNPHFMFNTLNGLQSVIFTKNDKEINNYFVKFSRLLRITLEVLNKEKVTLKDEINYLQSYLELEQIRKINNLVCTINIDDNLDLEGIEIPVMLLQPLLENAIEHGYSNLNKTSNLIINVKKIINTLIIEIEDDGIGVDLDKINNKEYLIKNNSFACNNIKDRIKVLNYFSKNKYKIEWFNLNNENKTGTKVIFSINLTNGK